MRVYTPPKRRHRRKWPWLTASGIMLVCASYTALVLTWPVQAVTATKSAYTPPARTSVSIVWPAYGQGAFGADGYGVLSSSQPTETPLPIASITKIVTALTVLEAKPINQGQSGPVITLTADDAARYGQYLAINGSVARAEAGMQLTEYQMLQGMLISSANNYADSLAIWAYGSMEAYLVAAQTYLTSQNLTNTSVKDASGFSSESKSAAGDLVRLGMIALKNPVLKEIVSQKTVTIPHVGILKNTNLLLGANGIIGTKTGTTDEAGSCLLFAATFIIDETPVTLSGVLLGAPNHATLFRDVASIVSAAQTGFQSVQLAESNQRFGAYTTPWGTTATAVAQTKLSEVTWHAAPITHEIKLLDSTPSKARSTVGNVAFKTGNGSKRTALVLDRELAGPSWQWRLTHPQQIF